MTTRILFHSVFLHLLIPILSFAQPSPLDPIDGPLGGMIFVAVPAAVGDVGASESYRYFEDDQFPRRFIDMHSFDIMTTEVTQGMWTAVLDSNPSIHNHSDLHPVDFVSWDEVQVFIEHLNRIDPLYHYRLPTEAEWEYACRAFTTSPHCNEYEGSLDDYMWYERNGQGTSHPVAQKRPNYWGIYDMHGNVFEWCEDWYHDSYEGAPSDGSAWLDPPGRARVRRGGAYNSHSAYCQSCYRDMGSPDSHYPDTGFRLVRTAVEE